MKLKTLSRINRAVVVVLAILLLPFAIVGGVLDLLIKPFAWVCGDMSSAIQKRVGNRLLLMADEVRISTSGGNFPHEVKRAAAEFIRALQKHEQAVTDGKYYQHKDVNVTDIM